MPDKECHDAREKRVVLLLSVSSTRKILRLFQKLRTLARARVLSFYMWDFLKDVRTCLIYGGAIHLPNLSEPEPTEGSFGGGNKVKY